MGEKTRADMCKNCSEREIIDEICSLIDDPSFVTLDDDVFNNNLKNILKLIRLYLKDFEDSFLIKEIIDDSGVYQISACDSDDSELEMGIPGQMSSIYEECIHYNISKNILINNIERWAKEKKINKQYLIKIPKETLDRLFTNGKNYLFIDDTSPEEIYSVLCRLAKHKIISCLLFRFRLRSGCNLILILTSSKHNLKKMYSEKSISLVMLSQAISKELRYIFFIRRFISDAERRDEFMIRAAHSLSLPVQAILADSYNIMNNINFESRNYLDCKHLFYQAQSLQLMAYNILHGAEDKTDQPNPTFQRKSILTPLKEACLMFDAEAKDKGCDIRTYININSNELEIALNKLDNNEYIYKSLLHSALSIDIPLHKFIEETKIESTIVLGGVERRAPIHHLPRLCFDKLNNQEVSLKLNVKFDGKCMALNAIEVSKLYMPYIEIVPFEISLMFKNLLHNAVKYSYRMLKSGKKRYVKVNVILNKDNNYEIKISNYGVGILEEEKELIWKPRYRGLKSRDRNRTGAGLGLPLVKHVVEEIHHGEVFFDSIELNGKYGPYLTIFTVKLPISHKYTHHRGHVDANTLDRR